MPERCTFLWLSETGNLREQQASCGKENLIVSEYSMM